MFLARSLPFLQQDLSNIPKVFRMPTGEPLVHSRNRRAAPPAADPGLSKLEPIEIDPPVGRSGSRLRQLGRVLQALDSATSVDNRQPDVSVSNLSSASNSSVQLITNNHNGTDRKSSEAAVNSTESRQKLCEQTDGM